MVTMMEINDLVRLGGVNGARDTYITAMYAYLKHLPETEAMTLVNATPTGATTSPGFVAREHPYDFVEGRAPWQSTPVALNGAADYTDILRNSGYFPSACVQNVKTMYKFLMAANAYFYRTSTLRHLADRMLISSTLRMQKNGSARYSRHLLGLAADVHTDGPSKECRHLRDGLLQFAGTLSLPVGVFMYVKSKYSWWVHVDILRVRTVAPLSNHAV